MGFEWLWFLKQNFTCNFIISPKMLHVTFFFIFGFFCCTLVAKIKHKPRSFACNFYQPINFTCKFFYLLLFLFVENFTCNFFIYCYFCLYCSWQNNLHFFWTTRICIFVCPKFYLWLFYLMLFCLYYSWQKNLYFFVCPKKLYVTFLYDVILGRTVVGKNCI